MSRPKPDSRESIVISATIEVDLKSLCPAFATFSMMGSLMVC